MLPPRRPTYRNELVCATRRYADKLSAGSMQSHNLQYAPARYVLHFFHFVKEQTSNNRQPKLPTEKSDMTTLTSSCLTARTLLRESWWSWSGSNRRPTACKAAALPAELQPLFFVSCLELPKQTKKLLVGLVGFEPTTPALSRRCSNQLSYRPRSFGRFPFPTTDKCGCLTSIAFPERR